MEAYLKAMMNVKHQIDEVAKRILGMLDGCKHATHLPQAAQDVRKKVGALCGQAGKFYLLVNVIYQIGVTCR